MLSTNAGLLKTAVLSLVLGFDHLQVVFWSIVSALNVWEVLIWFLPRNKCAVAKQKALHSSRGSSMAHTVSVNQDVVWTFLCVFI